MAVTRNTPAWLGNKPKPGTNTGTPAWMNKDNMPPVHSSEDTRDRNATSAYFQPGHGRTNTPIQDIANMVNAATGWGDVMNQARGKPPVAWATAIGNTADAAVQGVTQGARWVGSNVARAARMAGGAINAATGWGDVLNLATQQFQQPTPRTTGDQWWATTTNQMQPTQNSTRTVATTNNRGVPVQAGQGMGSNYLGGGYYLNQVPAPQTPNLSSTQQYMRGRSAGVTNVTVTPPLTSTGTGGGGGGGSYGWGKGGGGGGGGWVDYSRANQPAWYLNLVNWNFKG